MTINNTMQPDKDKRIEQIRFTAEKALILLTNAEYSAAELSNSNLLDHKQARVISTYFDRALMPTRELIEYLESLGNEPGTDKAIAQIDRGHLVKVIADTYQKYFIDRETSAGVPYIIFETDTGRVIGHPSVLPLRDSDLFITKLTEGCYGDNVSSAADIVYFLTEISPEWVEELLTNSGLLGEKG